MWRKVEKHLLAAFFIVSGALTLVTILLIDDILFEIRSCRTDTERNLAVFKSYADDAWSLMTDPTAISMRRNDFFVMLKHVSLRKGCSCAVEEALNLPNSTIF